MSSLKMTFSLASLVLLMAFIAMPVMAHNAEPLVIWDDYDGFMHTDHPVMRRLSGK